MASAALAVPPILAAALLITLPSAVVRRWVEQSTCLLTLLLAVLLPWLTESPGADAATLFAMLIGVGALADAAAGAPTHRMAQAAGQARLAAMLLTLLPVDPLLSLLFLAVASTASAARRLPHSRTVASRLLASNAAVGVALFGVVALQATSAAIGDIALALAWSVLAVLDVTLLLPILLLALRLQATAAHGAASGTLMVLAGLAAILASVVVLLLRPGMRRPADLMTLAQSGIVLCAFGLHSAEPRFAGLVHLTLLVLARAALLLSGTTGLDRAASLLGLSGLPPFGLFPSLVLVLAGVAAQAPWLLLPLGAGLLGLGWSGVTRLPAASGPSRPTTAWLPLALGLLLGFAMPDPIAAWFHSLTVASP